MPIGPTRLSLAALSIALLCTGCNGEVETAVKDKLTDPDSAKFSEILTKDGVTCGVVNSKNRMGGYSGPRTFLYKQGSVYFVDDPGFDAAGYEICSAKALNSAVNETSEAVSRRR